MLKIEIDSYNQSALRHIGAALTAMAEDLSRPVDALDKRCAVGEVYPPTNVGLPLVQKSPESVGFPAPPVSNEHVAAGCEPFTTPPPPPAIEPEVITPETDDDFPDPPGALDSAGIPWDARIHAGTKTKCKDGTWKNKPGLDPALLASVTAELKGVQAIPTPPAPATPPAAGPTTFAELIKELTPLLTGGKLTAQQVNEQCQTHGLPNCNALAGRVDLIPTVWSQICLIAG